MSRKICTSVLTFLTRQVLERERKFLTAVNTFFENVTEYWLPLNNVIEAFWLKKTFKEPRKVQIHKAPHFTWKAANTKLF